MIRRLLVANRGEVARRIFATCRSVGIETVAVHSTADTDSPSSVNLYRINGLHEALTSPA